jgi:hypothetical protein
MKGKEMRYEKKIFCIKIIDKEAKLLFNTLGSTLAYPMFREGIWYLVHVVFL